MSRVRGVADLGVEQQFGQPQLRFEMDRSALAANGITVADAHDAIETAVGGRTVTTFLEGDRVFDVSVRYDGDGFVDVIEDDHAVVEGETQVG